MAAAAAGDATNVRKLKCRNRVNRGDVFINQMITKKWGLLTMPSKQILT